MFLVIEGSSHDIRNDDSAGFPGIPRIFDAQFGISESSVSPAREQTGPPSGELKPKTSLFNSLALTHLNQYSLQFIQFKSNHPRKLINSFSKIKKKLFNKIITLK